MKKTITLVCVLSLCLLLSGCGSVALGGLSTIFGSNSNDPGSSANPGNSNSPSSPAPSGSSGGFSIDLSQGEYAKGGDAGFLGDVMHTYWFNFAVESGFTCKTYGGYTAPDDYQLLVIRMGLKNPYSESVDMFDYDFLVWWDDTDDVYATLLTTRTDVDDEEIHVDSPLSDDMFPGTYVLGINQTRIGELIFQVPALDKNGRENRDFTISFVEIFDTDNEDERFGDYYFVDFTAESK